MIKVNISNTTELERQWQNAVDEPTYDLHYFTKSVVGIDLFIWKHCSISEELWTPRDHFIRTGNKQYKVMRFWPKEIITCY